MSNDELSPRRLLLLASAVVTVGMLGFHFIEGLISDDAGGLPWVNAFYCAVITLTTVGYGDICPSDKVSFLGKSFIVALSFCGLGLICGPVMDWASSWRTRIPGGILSTGVAAIVFGTLLFVYIEDMAWHTAIYCAFITGTTIGYGDLSPKTDFGRLAVAL